jgi:hypothetical protein
MVLDFPSGTAFRNTCQRYLHARPQEIRAWGGAAFVLRSFIKEAGLPEAAPSPPEAGDKAPVSLIPDGT